MRIGPNKFNVILGYSLPGHWELKMQHFFYRCFRLTYTIKRWFIRRFTAGGFMIGAWLIASAVVGLDTHLTVAYRAFTFLLAILIIAGAWSLAFRGRFDAMRMLPKFGTVGERLVYRVTVLNRTRKIQKGLYLFEESEDPRPTFEAFAGTPEPGEESRNLFDRAVRYHRWLWLISRKQISVKKQLLPVILPGGEADMPIEIVPTRRGLLNLTGMTIARPDPLGLFHSFITIPASQSVLILPKRYALPPLHLPGNRRYQSGGVALTTSVGDSEEFVSMRDYRPGDPLRRIHWKSWAKTGKPIVKEYQDEFFVRHALVLDTFMEAAYSEIFEEAVSVASSFACSVRTQESLLDLMFVGPEAYCFTSGRGIAHTDSILEILASVSTCRDKPFSVLAASVLERCAVLSGCICILLDWDEERKAFVRRLRVLGIPVLVLIITDPGTGKTLDPDPIGDIPDNFHPLEIGRIQEGLGKL